MTKPGSDGKVRALRPGGANMSYPLPWFAVFSEVYSLYFFVALATRLLLPCLFIFMFLMVAPLAVLLLLVMPAGADCAAFRGPSGGWFGWLTRAGLVAWCPWFSPWCTPTLMLAVGMPWFFWEGVDGAWEPFMLWGVAVLVFECWAMWLAWQWLPRVGLSAP